jgi:mono/diheme cytochrome c family protein
MTTKLIRTIVAAAAVLAAGLVLVACSSDNATGPTDAQVQDAVGTSTAQTTEATTTEETTTTEAAPTTTQAATADGKEVFATNCAGCHTLAAADASGQVGPNLDQTKPSKALAIDRVTNGKAGMPAFEGQLSPEEITAVATYVSDNAG